ncbi:MAG: hypothetical protein VX675_02295, partial [Planctomycetota bacterium]|nr:hypothetical protein [Planctomycetota bacterium]
MNNSCKTCIFLILLSLYASPARCDDPAAGQKWAIRGGKVVTITKGNLEGAVVLVSGSRIEKVIPRPGEDWKPPAGYKLIDAGERWVVPGFIEMHSHIGGGDLNDMVYPVNPGFRTLDNVIPRNALLKRAQAGGVTTALFI